MLWLMLVHTLLIKDLFNDTGMAISVLRASLKGQCVFAGGGRPYLIKFLL